MDFNFWEIEAILIEISLSVSVSPFLYVKSSVPLKPPPLQTVINNLLPLIVKNLSPPSRLRGFLS
jgi:hypothetical protein